MNLEIDIFFAVKKMNTVTYFGADELPCLRGDPELCVLAEGFSLINAEFFAIFGRKSENPSTDHDFCIMECNHCISNVLNFTHFLVFS